MHSTFLFKFHDNFENDIAKQHTFETGTRF